MQKLSKNVTEKFDNGRFEALASAPVDWIQPMTKRKNPSIVDATNFTTQAGLQYVGNPQIPWCDLQQLLSYGLNFFQLLFWHRHLWQTSWGQSTLWKP